MKTGHFNQMVSQLVIREDISKEQQRRIQLTCVINACFQCITSTKIVAGVLIQWHIRQNAGFD